MSEAFWGLIIKGNSHSDFEIPEDRSLILNNVAIEPSEANTTATLFIKREDDKSKISLCTLTSGRVDQFRITTVLPPGTGKVVFSVEGKGTLHIIGHLKEDDNDDFLDDMSDLESDDDESDEEVVVPKKAGKEKPKQKVEKPKQTTEKPKAKENAKTQKAKGKGKK